MLFSKEVFMLDIAYIAIALVFFGLAALGVRACERL